LAERRQIQARFRYASRSQMGVFCKDLSVKAFLLTVFSLVGESHHRLPLSAVNIVRVLSRIW